MIYSEKREVIAIAAIAVLVLLAAVPAVVAAEIIFEDDFESGNLNKWASTAGDVDVTTDLTYAPPWGGSYVRFSGSTDGAEDYIIANIDTTCMKNISLSFARRTVNLSVNLAEKGEWFLVKYENGPGVILNSYNDSLDWSADTLPLPISAENNSEIRLKFVLGKDADPREYAFLDNVTVTGEPMVPALEVNKTVWNGTAWVKSVNASFNETLQFTCTITNTGEVNLTQIRFWDILDCSLQFADWPYLVPCDSYMFKPKVLHPIECWDPSNPGESCFTELCPFPTQRCIRAWNDTNNDGNVSACDQIYLTSESPKWYHVDRVPYTLTLSNATYGTKYFDSVLNWDEMDLMYPLNSTWLEVCCCKDRYTLIGWKDQCPTLGLSYPDLVTLRNERTQQVVEYTVEEMVKDLVVSREWEVGELDNPTGRILVPNQTITILYNATVVRCGVDNNTFTAKGLGCGDTWTYSNVDKVTITVPCPDGDAADDTPAVQDVYYAGEPVYALGSGFAPNTLVDIYVFNDRKWLGDEDLTAIAPQYASALGVQVDTNGNIGINALVLVWANPTPGEYDMVFDANQNGVFDPFIDAVDHPNHPGFIVLGQVPAVTPLGIIALIGLLGIVAISTLVKKRRE